MNLWIRATDSLTPWGCGSTTTRLSPAIPHPVSEAYSQFLTSWSVISKQLYTLIPWTYRIYSHCITPPRHTYKPHWYPWGMVWIDRPYPGDCCYGNNNTLHPLVTLKICCTAGLLEREVCSLMCAVFMVYTPHWKVTRSWLWYCASSCLQSWDGAYPHGNQWSKVVAIWSLNKL